ncbi:MAG: ABC transporter ATP-binding protein, partial [Alphaproteobacteria bacterium]|nr:ABC transporter ATP-binding protein [Alphaproteobacteria bacterium]
VGTPPMNLIEWDSGHLGFRPEHFLPKEMIRDDEVTEFSFRVDRAEYLGSERIVYGELEGLHSPAEVTAKLPPAHVPLASIRRGEWHAFAVRNSQLCYFDKDGKQARRY